MTALINDPVITTELTAYRFNLDDKDQCQKYTEMNEHLKAQGLRLMRVYSMDDSSVESGSVHLECRHLFDNQWNTTSDSPSNPGRRVFDWYETIVPNDKIRIGHYLEITDEIRQLRDDVLKCGYCGNHEWKNTGMEFCDSCLGSEYLGEDDLHLTRLLPISSGFGQRREKLSEEELAERLPKYAQYQSEALSIRQKREAEESRNSIIRKCDKAIKERDGFLWLLDSNIPVKNCIFYGGKKGFAFGWRSPITGAAKEALEAKLKEFPFTYTFV